MAQGDSSRMVEVVKEWVLANAAQELKGAPLTRNIRKFVEGDVPTYSFVLQFKLTPELRSQLPEIEAVFRKKKSADRA